MTDEQFTKQADDKFIVLPTKVSRHAAEQLYRIAKRKNMTVYKMLQMACDTFIRYGDDRYNLSESIERAMSLFEHMTGWADAMNLADPTLRAEVAQAVYIFQDADGKQRGFRAKMVDKPFMGQWTEDSNVMHIFERIFNICMPELYMKLYRARVILECESVSEVINMLADAELLMRMNEESRKDFEDAARMDNGKQYGYGMKTTSLHHRTPDTVATDQRLKFDDDDREAAEKEASL